MKGLSSECLNFTCCLRAEAFGQVMSQNWHFTLLTTREKSEKKTLSVFLITTLRIGILIFPCCNILEFPNSNLIKDMLDKAQSTGHAMATTESLLVFTYWDIFVTYHGAACDLVICVLSRNALNNASTGNFHLQEKENNIALCHHNFISWAVI